MIWKACTGEAQIRPIQGLLFRMVESQQQVATLSFVDTLEEQAMLEELLEASKPRLPPETETLHYLLRTPFRYPPLKWGSRFGRVHEAGIFYGSRSIPVTLAEAAFYRFFFWRSMTAAPVKPTIRTRHSLFSARYKTNLGIKLQEPPFDRYQDRLTDRQAYTDCQLLGTAMRQAGVEAFEYASARHHAKRACVAAFSPRVFPEKQPAHVEDWLCELSATRVAFKQIGDPAVSQFGIEDFLLDGEFPLPA